MRATLPQLRPHRVPRYICLSCRLLPCSITLSLAKQTRRTFSTTQPHPTRPSGKKAKVEPPYDPTAPLLVDHRNRLSTFFAPTGGITAGAEKNEDVHSLLVRAGYLRQAHSGIFHLLPLGLRVHDKIERVIDKHMRAVGASKLALSSISSEALWTKSGRLEKGGAELFRFQDRRDTSYLLSPTHEEEITSLVATIVNSYRQLPLRVYQISRKYRDERRPRAGLLRGREFTMKDLYTFDVDEATAIETYNLIQQRYEAIFEELGVPLLVSEADSGNMGGKLSHEYHYPSATGEDVVISCTSCAYSANEACAKTAPPKPTESFDPQVSVFHGISKDRKTLINVFYPKLREPVVDTRKRRLKEDNDQTEPQELDAVTNYNEVNLHRIKELVPEFDPSVQSPIELFRQHFKEFDATKPHFSPDPEDPNAPPPPQKHSQIINIYDYRLACFPEYNTSFANHGQLSAHFFASKDIPTTTVTTSPVPEGEQGEEEPAPLNVLKIREGDLCPRCTNGSLTLTNAIELGHTFHLGTRYSVPLGAKITSHLDVDAGKLIPMSMGCHGIGVSRMIAAIAEGYRDERGLMWPRVVAPFEVCIIGTRGEGMEDVYDILTAEDVDAEPEVEELGCASVPGAATGIRRTLDVILDDRQKSLVWKMNDADLIGYPVVLVLGRTWKGEGKVEVQCRRKGIAGKDKTLVVEVGELRNVVEKLLDDL